MPDGSDVIDVPVSPSSVVTELCGVSPSGSDWEFVEPQSFSSSKKRAHCGTDTQEEMRYERLTSESTSDNEKKYDSACTDAKIRTPPLEGSREVTKKKEEDGNARGRTIIAGTKQYLERSFSVKVQVEALEALLGPEDVDVDLRRSLKEARDEQGRRIFETFGSNDMSFLVAEWSTREIMQKSTMETRFVGLCKRWMVASKLGTASGTDDSRLEPR